MKVVYGSAAASAQKAPHTSSRPSESRPTSLIANVKRHSLGIFGAVTLLAAPFPAIAEVQSAQLFATTCAGCHAGGGNIVRRDATLQLEDLTKYGVAGPDEIYSIIYSGKGSMPGYGEGCTPKGACTFAKRLTDDEIRGLSSYVLEQAKGDWKGGAQ